MHIDISHSWSRLTTIFVSRKLEGRDYSLDIFKGLAIIGMIMVNHAPPGGTMYAPFVHVTWNGWAMADTIFPAFLFAVGVSIAIALPNREQRPTMGALSAVYMKIVRRSLLLIAISAALMNFPYYELGKLVIAGVLAQIAWCYLAVSLIQLHTTWRGQIGIVIVISLSNWALLTLIDVPGFGRGILTPDGNASRYLDLLILGRFAHIFDVGDNSTAGFLVIASSIATTLIGALAGRWLRTSRPVADKIGGLFAAGFGLFTLANAWDVVLPINKLIWTGSYIALTGGISLQVLALCYWLSDTKGFKYWTWPLHVAGVNALAFYLFAQCLQRLLVYGRVRGDDGVPVRLRVLLYEKLFASWNADQLGAFAYTLTFLLICFAAMWFLHRRKIFLKL